VGFLVVGTMSLVHYLRTQAALRAQEG
jgi:hypothetical protein